jgi:hypothetical protein
MLAAGAVQGQLVITEIMSDPTSPNDDAWEWIEVKNDGAAPIDLNGYIADRLGDPQSATIAVDGAKSANTIIPAGGVAVLYDADVAVSEADFNDALFRTAWGLAPTAPLIGVSGNFGSGLTNGAGTTIGFWPDADAYSADVADDGMGVVRVAQFTNAAFSIDFRMDNGFPAAANGKSIAWNGSGSNQSGANWAVTESGVTSVPATVPGNTNSTADIGNAGVLPPGTAPVGLWITEIMFDPRSADTQWEWVEIYNNTGAGIDFAATPYVFDDDDDAAKSAANLTSGVIPNGGVAVLFDGSQISISDMQAAWDPNGTLGTNFIAATSWTGGLTNGGDRFGLWPSLAAYQSEVTTSGGNNRTMDNASVAIAYDDTQATAFLGGVTGTWPNPDGNGSYSLTSLSLVSNQSLTPTNGDSWALSGVGDSLGSFNAAGISGTITVHPGGDLGTPGTLLTTPAGDADFDNDSDVDGRDFLIWQRGLGNGTNNLTGDANGDGIVDAADLAVWKSAFGGQSLAAVPEPGALALVVTAAVAVCGLASQRQSSGPCNAARGRVVARVNFNPARSPRVQLRSPATSWRGGTARFAT